MSASVQRKLKQAHDLLAHGETVTAAALCEEVLQRAPRNPHALWLLGTARLIESRPAEAAVLLEHAVAADTKQGAALESLGVAYLMLARFADAETVLRKAAGIARAPLSVRMRLGIALLNQDKSAAAIDELGHVLAAEPENLDARVNLGLAHARGGAWPAAVRELERVLQIEPRHADALYNLGIASLELGETDRARAAFERIGADDPPYVDARQRLASMSAALGRYREAIHYLREAIRCRPGDAETLAGLASALFQTGALDEARSCAREALALTPDAAGAHSVLALTHYVRGEIEETAAVLEQGYERTAAHGLLGLWVHLLHRMCEWDRHRAAWERMAPLVDTVSDLGSPFYLLCEATTPEQQLAYAKRWASARFGLVRENPPPRGASRAKRRLRVGYFSSDFQAHAAAYLVTEVLELHDRARFEIFAYSYGPDDSSAMRARVRDAVEHFIDVAWEPDDLVAARMREHDLDVLVDLKGYTVGDRLQVMARRPAPVQVTWLGYPGTTGADFIDYLIADEIVVPRGAESRYSERILRMPHCYQANDRKRPPLKPRMRAEYGLPEDAFVFCCFNQAVKITPEVYGRWMSLLREVAGSVLWLPEDNPRASMNLKRAAQARGVEPQRIVFGQRLPFAEHLARFAVADLALDTFPYTSHTTASDGLWMGCPLVALCGETFAARVSASVLAGCGLGDLVTYTLDEYETLARRLATDADFMAGVRRRLAAARTAAPLFDAPQFARDLEALYLQIAG